MSEIDSETQIDADEIDSETLFEELASIQRQNRRLELEIGTLQGRLRLARSLGRVTSSTSLTETYDRRTLDSLGNLKRLLLRSLLFLQSPPHPLSSSDDRTWYYIDGSQRRHGPFKTSQMNKWRQSFHPRQHMSCTPRGPYVTFGEAFGDSQDFSLSPRDLQLARVLLLEFLKPR